MGAGLPRDSVAPWVGRSPPGPASAQLGRGASGEGARGGPAAPTASSAPFHPEGKRNPRGTKPPVVALAHPGCRISPHTPRQGGNPFTPGRSRENASSPPPPAPLPPPRGSGARRGEAGKGPSVATGAARDMSGSGSRLMHLNRQRCSTPTPAPVPPSSLLPLRGRGTCAPRRGETRGASAAPPPPLLPRAPPALRLFRFLSGFKENISSNPDFWKITTGGETQTQTPLKFIQSLNDL